MAEIASKLKDPALRKGAAADDLAALEAFYTERERRAALGHADGLYRAGAGADRRDPECR